MILNSRLNLRSEKDKINTRTSFLLIFTLYVFFSCSFEYVVRYLGLYLNKRDV